MTNQEYFAMASSPNIQRSTFDRSSGLKTTINAGKLYPIFIDEALPGDTFSLKATTFGRMATPIKPIMDNMYVDMHFFACPIRLVWDNFKRFMGEQDNPDDDISDLVMPTMESPSGGYEELSIYDYLALPTKIEGLEHRSDPLRAINLIWNEFFRDENLQDRVVVNKGDTQDSDTDYQLLPRGKRKDYFTSALPFAQKGEQVSIPLGQKANVHTGADVGEALGVYSDATKDFQQMYTPTQELVVRGTSISEDLSLYADLTSASAATINQLREAFSIQRMFEKDARGGSRFAEQIYSHFGVTFMDAKYRPEFLGGGTSKVNISPVAQTSDSVVETTPQGNLSAIGTFGSNVASFIKSFDEHTIIIGFASIRADLTYSQGLNRMWSRKTRFDHYFPSLAHLGEQAILNKEIYAQGKSVVNSNGTPVDDDVWGYSERFAEYRFKPSQITGLFRSNATASLDVWHLSQEFGELPLLNEQFIKEEPPIDRVVAVTDEPHFLLDAYFDLKCTRPMPIYSIPSIETHY